MHLVKDPPLLPEDLNFLLKGEAVIERREGREPLIKKLSPCADSAVVEGLKVINKVVRETGFPCISAI